MKIAFLLILFALVLPACRAESDSIRQNEKIKVTDLNGEWIFVAPQSDNGQLLMIKDGKIEGSSINVTEYFKSGNGKTPAFSAKINAITATTIDLEQIGSQPKSDWAVATAQYDFELRQETTGEVVLWIDFLRRPELKAAGVWYHKLDRTPKKN